MHRPLLRLFPNFSAPWLSLGSFPTPVQRLEALGAAHGLDLWIKRDDLSAPRYGGNKVRKLEFLLGDAKARGARTLLTFGATGSNHAVATALYGCEHGFRVVAILVDQLPAPHLPRNLLLGAHWGAELIRARRPLAATIPVIREWLYDPFLYLIPPGGSSAVGILGYVNAALELAEQIHDGELPQPAAIFLPSGTGGTQTGLMLGLSLAGLSIPVIGVRVTEPAMSSESRLWALYRKGRHLLGHQGIWASPRAEVHLLHDQFGEGYAVPTPAASEAAAEARQLEGLTLETTYSAKALAGALQESRRRGLSPVLFWHTLNSADLHAEVEAADPSKVPAAFRDYLRTAEPTLV